jgi:hypothetical protein
MFIFILLSVRCHKPLKQLQTILKRLSFTRLAAGAPFYSAQGWCRVAFGIDRSAGGTLKHLYFEMVLHLSVTIVPITVPVDTETRDVGIALSGLYLKREHEVARSLYLTLKVVGEDYGVQFEEARFSNTA